jgi:hypothetical protein
MDKTINSLLKERSTIIKKNHDDERADKLSDKIRKCLIEKKTKLPVEYIMETLAKAGYAPSLYSFCNSDRYYFAVTDDAIQNMPNGTNSVDDIAVITEVKKTQWKNTVRKALYSYLTRKQQN